MPNIKSSIKAVKVIEKKKTINHDYLAKVKNYIKKCEKAIIAGDKELANQLFKNVQKNIDNAVSKGVIKKNTAARQKSRLSAKIKALKK